MATKAFQLIQTHLDAFGIRLFQWPGLENGDDGYPLIFPQNADKSVHVKGTWGVGGSLLIEGSNDKESPEFVTLHDPQTNSLVFTANKGAAILENMYQIRPRVIGGDETTNLIITVLTKG